MKQVIMGLIIALLLTGCQQQVPEKVPSPEPLTEVMTEQAQTVSLVIDDGVQVATYSAPLTPKATVMSVLNRVAEEALIPVDVEVYDFGALVIAINGKQNSTKKAWIYFVNGMAGDVGADQKTLESGDVVEWKYIEPIY